jgi:hypothetical protein
MQVDRLASRRKFGARIDGGTKRSVAVSYFSQFPRCASQGSRETGGKNS